MEGNMESAAKAFEGFNEAITGASKSVDSFVSTAALPSEEVKRRWFSWTQLVASGRKGSYQGLPNVVTVRIEHNEDGEAHAVYDYSARRGAELKIERRRAKNKVGRRQRRVNNGR